MITFALAQHDFLVGDIRGNLCKSHDLIAAAKAENADLILFPELALTGYPPEDLLLRPGFLRSVHHAVDELTASVQGIDVVIGHPWEDQGHCHNAVSWLREGRLAGRYFKHLLPNYAVFDEQRFKSGYNKFVETVLEYFKDRPQDLLILDVTAGDGWEKLCPF